MSMKKISLALSIIAILAVAFFAVPSSVKAAGLDQISGTRLENLLTREKLALNNQSDRLDLARQSADKAQKWIDDLDTQGKDTSDLVAGLAAFNQGIVSAQASHDQAAGILASPAGFDFERQGDRYNHRAQYRPHGGICLTAGSPDHYPGHAGFSYPRK